MQQKVDQPAPVAQYRRKIQPKTTVEELSTTTEAPPQKQLPVQQKDLEAEPGVVLTKVPQNSDELLFYTQEKTKELTAI